MKIQGQLVLAMLTAASVGGAWFLMRSPATAGESTIVIGSAAPDLPDRVLPELAERADEAQRIEITQEGSTITVGRVEGDRWGLVDRGGYPVRNDLLRPLLVGLAGLEPVAKKTEQPENHRRLALWTPDPNGDVIRPEPPGPRDDPREPPRQPDQPTRVRVLGAENTLLADVIVGKASRRGGNRAVFVRRFDEPQTWLATGSVDAPTEISRWIDRDIVNVERDDVARVEITRPNGERYVVVPQIADAPIGAGPGGRPPAPTFVVEPMPAGKKMASPWMGNSVGGGLGYLGIMDVRPASEPVTGETGAAVYTMNNGLKVTLTITKELYVAAEPTDDVTLVEEDAVEERVWVTIEAEGEGAEAINAKANGWLFRTSSAALENFQRPLDEMLADVEPGSAGASTTTPAPPAARRNTGPALPVDIGGFGGGGGSGGGNATPPPSNP